MPATKQALFKRRDELRAALAEAEAEYLALKNGRVPAREIRRAKQRIEEIGRIKLYLQGQLSAIRAELRTIVDEETAAIASMPSEVVPLPLAANALLRRLPAMLHGAELAPQDRSLIRALQDALDREDVPTPTWSELFGGAEAQ